MIPNWLLKSRIAFFTRKKLYSISALNPGSLLSRLQAKTIFLLSKKLHRLLPLSVPQIIYIEPTNLCNFKCRFCPTGDSALLKSMNIPRGKMDFSLFCKVVDDLAKFPEDIPVVYLHDHGEPLLNENISKMIMYIKGKKITGSVRLITNGSLLTKEKSIELIEAGLDLIIISIEHVTSEGYKKITSNFSDYDLIKKNVETFYKEKMKRNRFLSVYVKILNVDLSGYQIKTFLNEFNHISDIANVENPGGWSNSDIRDFTLGADPDFNIHGLAKLKRERKVCPSPFNAMVVLFDGYVSACCVDWSRGVLIGNAQNESMVDIWNGQNFKELRCRFIEGKKSSVQACAKCSFIQSFTPENDLDDHIKSLANKFEINSKFMPIRRDIL